MNKPSFWTTTKERINQEKKDQQMQQHKRTRLANREQAILTKFRRIEDRVISLPENNHDLEYMPVQKRDKNLFFSSYSEPVYMNSREHGKRSLQTIKN